MVKTIFYWTSSLGLLFTLILSYFWLPAAWLLLLIIPYTLLGYYDLYISTHNVLRNYPVLGHLRYVLESIRPEMQQYFVATNQSERPFSREIRSLVYQRAKHINDTLPFGTQQDITRPGFEFTYHSMAPCEIDDQAGRLRIGGKDCQQIYEASRLNISGMSYGALGPTAIQALNWGAKLGNFAQCTGEGGISPFHLTHGGDLIFQFGTGYFGCRDARGRFDPQQFQEKALLPVVKMIEIKISQGAKPSHGGLLPAAKITPEIAAIRGIPMGEDCLSPPAHSAFSTPIELMLFIQQLRDLSGGKPIGFKLCIGQRRQFLAICKAMLETGIHPDFICIDGAEGGTGAAPFEFSNKLGAPINEGLNFVHNALVGCGLRDQIRLLASGKIATGFDLMQKIALGADACNAARAMLFAVGCIQALKCNTNRCPTGITTQDPSRNQAVVPAEKKDHVFNYHRATLRSFLDLTGAIGLSHPDLLTPNHIYQRQDGGLVKSFAELYPQLQTGDLLSASLPPSYKQDWQHASSTSF